MNFNKIIWHRSTSALSLPKSSRYALLCIRRPTAGCEWIETHSLGSTMKSLFQPRFGPRDVGSLWNGGRALMRWSKSIKSTNSMPGCSQMKRKSSCARPRQNGRVLEDCNSELKLKPRRNLNLAEWQFLHKMKERA